MPLRNLFSKKLPSLDEENKKFKEALKKDEIELTEEELEHVNGLTTKEEWEAIQRAKKEQEEQNINIHR